MKSRKIKFVQIIIVIFVAAIGWYFASIDTEDAYAPYVDFVDTEKVHASHAVPPLDLVAPLFSLSGDTAIYLPVGSAFEEPGYYAWDNLEGNVTSHVYTSGTVDTSKKGHYQLTYTASDICGNSYSLSRDIYVFEKQEADAAINPGDKLVYLTFDDGPSIHTLTLLDILEAFGVNATFFVTNQYPYNNDTIGLTHDKGHTIAIHSYSHDYKNIYKSEKDYYADLEKISRLCEKQTGEKPKIVRFPGGTSNSVSKKYKKGIMTALTKSLPKKGYVYCDWNVDSGDAAGFKTADAVADNVITGIQKHDVSIVLQHDTSAYSVEAVKQILYWGLDNGYTFLPMTEDMTMIHFPTKN